MPRKSRLKVADVETALRSSGGIYAAAARILAQKYGSCSRHTVARFVHRHERLQRAEVEIVESKLDLAETKLMQAIGDGNMTAIIFYLKTKGAERGYRTWRALGNPDGTPLAIEDNRSVSVYLPDNGRDPELLCTARTLDMETLEELQSIADRIEGGDMIQTPAQKKIAG